MFNDVQWRKRICLLQQTGRTAKVFGIHLFINTFDLFRETILNVFQVDIHTLPNIHKLIFDAKYK